MMVTIDWKSLNEDYSAPNGQTPIGPAPQRQQGVREALRKAFSPLPELPGDLARLLDRLN